MENHDSESNMNWEIFPKWNQAFFSEREVQLQHCIFFLMFLSVKIEKVINRY